MQDETLLALKFQCGIDAGNETLASRLLISRGAIHLTGKVEVAYHL